MPMYRKILAAVDFSPHTGAVIRRALSLAQQNDAMLQILHVVDYEWPMDTDYVLPPVDGLEEKFVDKAHERLASLQESTGASGSERVVLVGRPKQEILREAERWQADLIVLGAHGHHSLAGLLGSTTDGVLHRAACEVLVVR